MTTSASSFPASRFDADVAGQTRHARTASDHDSLAALVPGMEGVVTAIALEPDLAAWVAAVGIRVGERLTVLRRAIFGGPIHVRTQAGGEFALARSLAHAIAVAVRPRSP